MPSLLYLTKPDDEVDVEVKSLSKMPTSINSALPFMALALWGIIACLREYLQNAKDACASVIAEESLGSPPTLLWSSIPSPNRVALEGSRMLLLNGRFAVEVDVAVEPITMKDGVTTIFRLVMSIFSYGKSMPMHGFGQGSSKATAERHGLLGNSVAGGSVRAFIRRSLRCFQATFVNARLY